MNIRVMTIKDYPNVYDMWLSCKGMGFNNVALLTFKRNEVANAFWEKQGFNNREDINYRNKQIKELIRIDT